LRLISASESQLAGIVAAKVKGKYLARKASLTHDQQKEVLKNLQSLQEGQQREYPRLSKEMDIDAVVSGKFIQTEARNLSTSGVYINTLGEFEIRQVGSGRICSFRP